MPVKASVVSTWTGFYFGVDVGYGWARPSISDFDLNQSNPDVNLEEGLSFHAPKLRGAVFGGHAGFNWQWSQRGVVGLEIDYSAADIKSTQQAAMVNIAGSASTRTLTAKLDGLASARARVGFLVGPELLLYGTGGAAWGHTKFTDTLVQNPAGTPDDITGLKVGRASANHFGWVVGAGAEWKLWDTGMMLRVEYLHYDFGSASLAFDNAFSNEGGDLSKSRSFNIPLDRLTTDVVRGGVSYKF